MRSRKNHLMFSNCVENMKNDGRQNVLATEHAAPLQRLKTTVQSKQMTCFFRE